jgi:hypothetical protein
MRNHSEDADGLESEDPFAPPEPPREVICLHCGEVFMSSEMRRSSGLWVCMNWETCGGAGYGWDILDATPEWREQLGK